ncbi:MAG: fused MFS/spermidine synthase [Anaerolineae bacterium]|nr:fused MFS/spermidine synthase [Anaerolineae bacterium]
MRKYLYTAVFISGLTSLAVEMASSRLLGAVFGTSNLVWASIIGLILIYLTVGNFLGGFWADRYASPRNFYLILIGAAIAIGIVPLVSRPVLKLAAEAFDQLTLGVLFGSFSAVLILLFIPITLLGMASPFAIRLAVQDNKDVGRISGQIYAISTLGSFVGTFLPSLITIPLFGTYRTFLILSAILLFAGLIGLWLSAGIKKVLPFFLFIPALILVNFWGLPGGDKATPGLIYETESAYNYIQVIEREQFNYLRLNEGQGVHSIYHPTVSNYHGPWEQVVVAPFFNPANYDPAQVQRIAIVGLAAGTTARQATQVYGAVPIDGFEIDPKIVEAGQKYFDMNEKNLNVIIQDGRWGLEHSPYRYQIISVDAYQPPYIPFHLTTREFFQIVYDHLAEDGVMAINVGRSPSDRSLINSLSSTILTVFPSVHVIDIPGSFNSIIFASARPTHEVDLFKNYLYLKNNPGTPALLLESMEITLSNLQPAPEAGLVFSDDHAPIEWITNNMILSFLFSNEMENIQ